MSDGTPTSYAELAAVVEALPILIRETRRRRGLSIRAAAVELDVSFSTLDRIERGAPFNSRKLPALLRWLDGGS